MIFDPKYMARCLQLASYGAGYVAPNPMVGAVIVCDNKIIGEGYHRQYGGPHAEPNAINSVKDNSLLARSTMYVSLEPCSHYGKTPPCADRIISANIPRVVVGTLDPNPKVAGRGISKMREAGIEVVTGVMDEECRRLNKRFFTFQEEKRPYVTLKWAQTCDGFIDHARTSAATPPLQISNRLTRLLTHKLRTGNQAIMVGTNTALLDNPTLTARYWSGNNPVRIVLDRERRIPGDYHLFDGSVRTIVFTEKEQPGRENIEYIQIPFDDNLADHLLRYLYEQNINSVLIEGGASLLNSFIRKNIWDEVRIEVSPLKAEAGITAPQLSALPHKVEHYQQNTFYYYERRS